MNGALSRAAIDRRSVGAQVYDRIRGAILDGTYAPGEKVVEAQVARTLGISRAPVREAVQRLVNDGLIDAVPGQGYAVAAFGVDDIRELYLLRVHVEELAMLQVIERCPQQAAADLERILASMERAAARGDLGEVTAEELRFHERLAELSGNRFLRFVNAKIAAFVRIALNIDNSRFASLDDIVAEHRPLVDALRREDAAGAPAIIRRHVMASLDNFTRAHDGPAGRRTSPTERIA